MPGPAPSRREVGESSARGELRQLRPQQPATLEIVVVPRDAPAADVQAPRRASWGILPDTLERIEHAVHTARSRPVLQQAAADLVNELRSYGPRAHRSDNDVVPAAVHADLINRITDKHLDRWFEAQGLRPSEVADLRKAAFLSGLPNPTGSFVSNALQYIASPLLSAATSNPWAGAGLGLVTALAAAPMNAAQQTAVVTLCESLREHLGPVVVPDKKNINDRHRLPDLATALTLHVEQLHANLAGFEGELARAGLANLLHSHPQDIAAAVQKLDPAQLQALQRAAADLVGTQGRAVTEQSNMLMTQGAHDRQWQGNARQAIPRTLRSPVAGFLSMMAHASTLPTMAGPLTQTAASLALTVGQHWAAGVDELNKQIYNNKLNLLYGDMYTDAGKQALKEGRDITASDIDPVKLRGFITSPAQALVKRATSALNALKMDLTSRMDGNEGEGSPIPARDGLTPAARRAAYEKDMAALESVMRDLKNLKSGNLGALKPGGLAEALLVGAEKNVLSQQLFMNIAGKYTAREFSAQTAQRIGQMFHMVVFGSAVPSVAGKVVSSALGGASQTPMLAQAGLAVASGAFSMVGAMNQHLAISVKNNRREAPEDPGLLAQVLRGIGAAPQEFTASRQGAHASRSLNEVLQQPRTQDLLRVAQAVGALPGAAAASGQVTIEILGADPAPT